MKTARIKLLLWITTATAVACALAVVVGAVVLPVETSVDTKPSSSHGQKETEPTSALPPLKSFEPAWQLPLRRALVDPPAQAVAAADKSDLSANPLAVRLIGTIVNDRHPRAVFLIGLSTVELKNLGDSVSGAKILAIDNNTATLLYQGETIQLHREKSPFDPTGESYEAAAPATTPDQP